jgi:hypothetical protein
VYTQGYQAEVHLFTVVYPVYTEVYQAEVDLFLLLLAVLPIMSLCCGFACMYNAKWSKSEVFFVHVKKAYEGVEVYPHLVLTSALDGGDSSASRLGRFALGDTPPAPIE